MPILVLIGFLNVVLRYTGELLGVKLTNNSVIEIQWYLYTLLFLLGFAYLLKNNINVRVDFWFAEQPPRRKAQIDFIGHILALLPFAVLAIFVTWNPVLTSWGHRPNRPFYTGWDRWGETGDRLEVIGDSCRENPDCRVGSWDYFQRVSGALPWEVSPDPDGLPRAPIKSMVIVAFFLLLLQGIVEMIKLSAILRDDHTFRRIDPDAPIRIE